MSRQFRGKETKDSTKVLTHPRGRQRDERLDTGPEGDKEKVGGLLEARPPLPCCDTHAWTPPRPPAPSPPPGSRSRGTPTWGVGLTRAPFRTSPAVGRSMDRNPDVQTATRPTDPTGAPFLGRPHNYDNGTGVSMDRDHSRNRTPRLTHKEGLRGGLLPTLLVYTQFESLHYAQGTGNYRPLRPT